MNDCKGCHWLKRLLCIIACPSVQKTLQEMDDHEHHPHN